MSVQQSFIDVVFVGKKNFIEDIVPYAGVPGYNADVVGELVYDYTNDDGYIATDKVGTWVKLNA